MKRPAGTIVLIVSAIAVGSALGLFISHLDVRGASPLKAAAPSGVAREVVVTKPMSIRQQESSLNTEQARASAERAMRAAEDAAEQAAATVR